MSQDLHREFGELRALLHRTQTSEEDWKEEVLALLVESYEKNEEEYRQTWIPYLSSSSFAHLWRAGTYRLGGKREPHDILEEFESHVEVAPFGWFSLWFEPKHPNPDREVEWRQQLLTVDFYQGAFWRRVWCLSLAGYYLRIEGAKQLLHMALLESEDLCHVSELDLSRNMLMDEGAEIVSEAGFLRQIKSLRLSGNEISSLGVQALVESPHLMGLESLRLGANSRIGDEGAVALSSATWFGSLRSLDVNQCKVTCDGVKALARSPNFLSLRELNLDFNPLRSEGLEELARAQFLSQLEVLSLRYCRVSHEGLRAFMKEGRFEYLKVLRLADNRIEDEGAFALARSTKLEGLRELDLKNCFIGDEGARALANAPWVSSLNKLVLQRNSLQAEGRRALASSPYLKESIREEWRG